MKGIITFLKSFAYASWNPFNKVLPQATVQAASLKNDDDFTGQDWLMLLSFFFLPLILLFFILKWLGVFKFLGFGKTTYRRRRRTTSVGRSIRRVVSGGKTAAQRRMAKVRSYRKKSPTKRKSPVRRKK